MSEENVQVVREIYARWGRGDFSDVTWADSEIEFVSPDGPAPVDVRGVAALGPAWAEWLSGWDDFSTRAEEFVDLGDTVLTLVRFDGRAKSSGLSPASQQGACTFTFRDGKVVRLVAYANRAHGVADATRATG